jgi:hypothetical protein
LVAQRTGTTVTTVIIKALMRQLSISPEKFVIWVNSTMPDAHRHISIQDIKDMTECRLIGRYGYLGRTDLETIRAVLKYEKLRQQRIERPPIGAASPVRNCKLCGKALPVENDVKHGRPREYCSVCESSRLRERHRKWRLKRAVRC